MKQVWILSLIFLAGSLFSCSVKESQQNQSATEIPSLNPEKVAIFRTAKENEDRWAKLPEVVFQEYPQPLETEPCVFVDPSHQFQTFEGIGGALTDASAEVFYKLSEEKQNELLSAYFDKEKGLSYSFARTNIASCDFSSASYDYVEENDIELKTFSIEHDRKFKIPFIKKSMAAAGGKLNLMISPWSPPAWMKSNKDRLHGGKLLDEYKPAWANHYIKFIQSYEAEDIPVWGLSVQNEPMATQIWESCIYSAPDERDFVKNHLGPSLEKAGMGGKKLIVWDHNRDLIYQRASTILNDPDAAKYIWGVGFHWYEVWTGSGMQFDNLKQVKEAFPDVNLIFTEGCVEKFDYNRLQDWSLGERYGFSMVNDFRSGTVAWIDWNILLDETGGPNHVGNLCFAPVHADLPKGELVYTNSFYYIGHFSRFVQPGARRISSSASRDKLQTVAFLNPDGKIVVVVLNHSDSPIPFKLWINGKAADLESLGHSIMTLVV